jgi:hypothetical protein
MRFDYKNFHIDCTSRHDEDGSFYARARITRVSEQPAAHLEVFESGDLDAFASESDALHCARSWAIEWCDEALD